MRPSASLIRRLRAEGHAAVVSGAGPTVLALAAGPEEADEVQAAVERFTHAEDSDEQLLRHSSTAWRVMRLAVDSEGAKVEVHSR
jgi:homoserine kinase